MPFPNFCISVLQVACWLLPLLSRKFPCLKKVWADGGYTGDWFTTLAHLPFVLEIAHNQPAQRGFKVIPWRWTVERTFAWLTHAQRLSKNYEYLVTTFDAMIYATMVRPMLRRLASH
jgi:putative transposase